jgi:hypothetical protein
LGIREDKKQLMLVAENVTSLAVEHVNFKDGTSADAALRDAEAVKSLADWLAGLTLTHVEFAPGKSPEDLQPVRYHPIYNVTAADGELWSFLITGIDDTERVFEYADFGGEWYVVHYKTWYRVGNPTNPPV